MKAKLSCPPQAHAYTPVHGEVHFNDQEQFSMSKGVGATDLYYVSTHTEKRRHTKHAYVN